MDSGAGRVRGRARRRGRGSVGRRANAASASRRPAASVQRRAVAVGALRAGGRGVRGGLDCGHRAGGKAIVRRSAGAAGGRGRAPALGLATWVAGGWVVVGLGAPGRAAARGGRGRGTAAGRCRRSGRPRGGRRGGARRGRRGATVPSASPRSAVSPARTAIVPSGRWVTRHGPHDERHDAGRSRRPRPANATRPLQGARTREPGRRREVGPAVLAGRERVGAEVERRASRGLRPAAARSPPPRPAASPPPGRGAVRRSRAGPGWRACRRPYARMPRDRPFTLEKRTNGAVLSRRPARSCGRSHGVVVCGRIATISRHRRSRRSADTSRNSRRIAAEPPRNCGARRGQASSSAR